MRSDRKLLNSFFSRVFNILVSLAIVAGLQAFGSRESVDQAVKKTSQLIHSRNLLTKNLPFNEPENPDGRSGYTKRLIDGYRLGDFQAAKRDQKNSDCSWRYEKDGLLYAHTDRAENGTCLLTNGFLNNWVPYNFSNPWLPHEFISRHLQYRYDSDQFGFSDLWQTAAQVFRRGYGDCEDYSVLLADWLAGMGYDARVVCGKVNWGSGSGGHCWVVLFHEGRHYLIEATSKSSRRIPPLAEMQTEYSAEYMLSRDYFWTRISDQGKRNYSEQYWRKTSAFSEYRDSCERQVFRAMAKLSDDQPQEAYEAIRKITETDENPAVHQSCQTPHLELGIILSRLQRYKDSISHFTQVPEDQRSVHYAVELGKAYFSLAQYEKALLWLRKAEEQHPAESDAVFYIAWALQKTGRLRESESYYLRYVERWPNSPWAYNNLGVVYESLGNIKKAISSYLKAVQLDPAASLYKRNLARLKVKQ